MEPPPCSASVHCYVNHPPSSCSSMNCVSTSVCSTATMNINSTFFLYCKKLYLQYFRQDWFVKIQTQQLGNKNGLNLHLLIQSLQHIEMQISHHQLENVIKAVETRLVILSKSLGCTCELFFSQTGAQNTPLMKHFGNMCQRVESGYINTASRSQVCSLVLLPCEVSPLQSSSSLEQVLLSLFGGNDDRQIEAFSLHPDQTCVVQSWIHDQKQNLHEFNLIH